MTSRRTRYVVIGAGAVDGTIGGRRAPGSLTAAHLTALVDAG
ncbi:hypothetical protein [Streptomyces albidochromogenes]|uniref:Uncharacterized protein n=1 Tax=Streptomyces albidochromogenes TaxID=329524 RepID=A0ABW6FPI4_9ACTN